MKKSLAVNLVILIGAALLLAACGDSGPGAAISAADLYLDPAGSQATRSYGWLDVFYCRVEVTGATPETVLQASWVAVDTDRLRADSVLKIDEIQVTSSPVVFELKNEGNFWPVGEYRVYLYLDDTLAQTIDFSVVMAELPSP